jgi:AI-2 transport system permease protein
MHICLRSAVTAVVLGGVDIFRGEGRILGVALAVMVCGFLQQGLLIKGYDSVVETMAAGVLLVVVIALRMALRRSDRRWLAMLVRYLPRRQPADG